MGCGSSTLEQSGTSLTRTESLLRCVVSAREIREAQSASGSPPPMTPVFSAGTRTPTPSGPPLQRLRQHALDHHHTPSCDSVIERIILTQNVSPVRRRGGGGGTASASPNTSQGGGSILCFRGSRSNSGAGRSSPPSIASFEREEEEQPSPQACCAQPSDPSRADNGDEEAVAIDFPALDLPFLP